MVDSTHGLPVKIWEASWSFNIFLKELFVSIIVHKIQISKFKSKTKFRQKSMEKTKNFENFLNKHFLVKLKTRHKVKYFSIVRSKFFIFSQKIMTYTLYSRHWRFLLFCRNHKYWLLRRLTYLYGREGVQWKKNCLNCSEIFYNEYFLKRVEYLKAKKLRIKNNARQVSPSYFQQVYTILYFTTLTIHFVTLAKVGLSVIGFYCC